MALRLLMCDGLGKKKYVASRRTSAASCCVRHDFSFNSLTGPALELLEALPAMQHRHESQRSFFSLDSLTAADPSICSSTPPTCVSKLVHSLSESLPRSETLSIGGKGFFFRREARRSIAAASPENPADAPTLDA